MNLIVWRHAQVEFSLLADLEIGLSEQGHRDAQGVARYLHPALPANCRVLVSPAKRAIQTAQTLQRPLEIVQALSPNGSVDAMLTALNWPQVATSDETVVMVGHQPWLGLLMSYLVNGEDRQIEVRNALAYWLVSENREGKAMCVAKTLFGPGGTRYLLLP